jgi:hypothetical protein
MLCGAALVLAACGEKPQTANPSKHDEKAWTGASDPYVVRGWTAGDQASWDQQIRNRAQSQNEYVRIGAAP